MHAILAAGLDTGSIIHASWFVPWLIGVICGMVIRGKWAG